MTKLHHSFYVVTLLVAGLLETTGCTGPYATQGPDFNAGSVSVHADAPGINEGSPESIGR